jgi:hypothetical protein
MHLYMVALSLVGHGCSAGNERDKADNGGRVQAPGRLG